MQASVSFWIGTIGILFYAIPLYWAGFTQSLMWNEFTDDGFLKYPNFLETVTQIVPMYQLRVVGGSLYLIGVIVMMYNLFKTAASGNLLANEEAEAPALVSQKAIHNPGEHWHRKLRRKPMMMLVISLIVILIGGIIEMVPTFMIKSNIPI